MSSWTVRCEEGGDVSAVQSLVADAFGGPRVAAMLSDMRRDHCWRQLSYVVTPASEPESVAGHVAYTRGWVDAREALIEVLILSPMAVLPECQRQGAGTALIRESLARLESRPEPLVFLEGSPDYYGRIGFEPAIPHGFTRPSERIPEAAFQVYRLDVPAAGEGLAGALVYPDVFWRHDAVGLR